MSKSPPEQYIPKSEAKLSAEKLNRLSDDTILTKKIRFCSSKNEKYWVNNSEFA